MIAARSVKQRTPGRDHILMARLEETAKQTGLAGFTVNAAGLAAITADLDDRGKLFGYAVFAVLPQKERVRAWFSAEQLSNYLSRFRLKR